MKPNPKYLKIFRTEATELVGRIAGQLLDLEGGKADLGALRQDLHTLKGSARLVGLKRIGALVHALESLARDGSPLVAGDADAVDLALETLDAIEGLAGLGKPEPDEAELVDLEGRLAGKPVEASAEAPSETPAPAPARGPEPRGADLEIDAAAESVRVTVRALDQLLNLSGELLLQHQRMAARFDQGQKILRLVDTLRQVADLQAGPLEGLADAVRTLTRDLEADMVDAGFLFSEVRTRTTEIRLQPLETLIEPLERQVRGEARRLGKPVRLQVKGRRLELDRTILEQLRPVLIHCLTNAVVHGIEPAEEREARGKPPEGTIRFEAASDGNRVRLVIEDDGRGLDPGILRNAAVEKGFVDDVQADEMGDDEALSLIFTPGFSTARVVSDMAGRGVGMDAVRSNVERLRGQLRVESELGRFTRIVFVLPATIGVVQGLILGAGAEQVVLPTIDVDFSRKVAPGDVDDTGRVRTDEGPLPVVHLAEALGWGEARSAAPPWMVRLHEPAHEVALLVDTVSAEEEVVLKHPGRILAELPLVAGATIFRDGSPSLVLHATELARAARDAWEAAHGPLVQEEVVGDTLFTTSSPSRATSTRPPRPTDPLPDAAEVDAAPGDDPATETRPGSILVVDDSDTARALLTDAVADLGLEVLVAADGAAALEVLRENPVAVVVSDYDMPELDGLGLLRAVRERDPELPVLMVTDRADEVREDALANGAQVVLKKSEETYATLADAVRLNLAP